MPDLDSGILLIDADVGLQIRLPALLQPLQLPLFIASDCKQAASLISSQHITLLIGEPTDVGVSDFMQDMHANHDDMASLILTSHPEHPQVLQVLNQVQPCRLLVKSCSDEELINTVQQALEHVTQRREQQRLLREYRGILANAESAHAFRVLDALMHSIHKDMAAAAIHHLPVGALLLVNGNISQSNAPARRFLQEMEEAVAESGATMAHLPTALLNALHGPRCQRLQHRSAINRRLDYFVLELTAGTLIAFAPEPSLGRPPDA